MLNAFTTFISVHNRRKELAIHELHNCCSMVNAAPILSKIVLAETEADAWTEVKGVLEDSGGDIDAAQELLKTITRLEKGVHMAALPRTTSQLHDALGAERRKYMITRWNIFDRAIWLLDESKHKREK